MFNRGDHPAPISPPIEDTRAAITSRTWSRNSPVSDVLRPSVSIGLSMITLIDPPLARGVPGGQA